MDWRGVWGGGGLYKELTCMGGPFFVNLDVRYTNIHFLSFSFVCFKSSITNILIEKYVKASTEFPNNQQASVIGEGDSNPQRTRTQSRINIHVGESFCPLDSQVALLLSRTLCCFGRWKVV